MGLYLVAALLLANLAAVLARRESLLPEALANRQPPIAGGAGVFIMPAQLSSTQWGVYLLDVDNGTICVYQYNVAGTQLQFVAARDYRNDRRLWNFNTRPSPDDVRQLVEKQREAAREAEPQQPPPQ